MSIVADSGSPQLHPLTDQLFVLLVRRAGVVNPVTDIDRLNPNVLLNHESPRHYALISYVVDTHRSSQHPTQGNAPTFFALHLALATITNSNSRT